MIESQEMMCRDDNIVEIRGLTRRFGAKTALDDVYFDVPRGSVFGVVGENGAGKTTLIRHILGLLKAQRGTVRVFGLDPVAEPKRVLARIGYLSEESDLPGWMRVGELIRYVQAFYPGWDETYADKLRQTFELDVKAKVKSMSKGQRARLGLLVALAYRPDLLLLDEPSSGLDPIVRRDILTAIIRTISQEGRTVLFSSHLLDEVERVSDHVAMIQRGRFIFSGPTDAVKLSHRRLTLRFEEPLVSPPQISGALGWEGDGCEWAALCLLPLERIEAQAASVGARVVDARVPSLDEIFVARSGRQLEECTA